MRAHLLNVEFDALTMTELNSFVSTAIASSERVIVANHNLHSVYLFQKDSRFREYYNMAGVIHIDGVFLVALAQLLGFPVRRQHRVTYLDWIYPLLELSASEGWKVFYVGGKPGVAERAASIFREKYPRLQLKTHHGYFDKTSEQNETVIQYIDTFKPNLLILGMGMPVQEHWALDNLERLGECVILSSGACFDYIAGAIPTPPRWIGKIGLEWLFRLASEPKRLWKRYLLEPWYVLILVLKEILR